MNTSLKSLSLALAASSTMLANSFAVDTTAPSPLKGQVNVGGSSTVAPMSEAISEQFGKLSEYSQVQAPVASSGTGAGFQKFCRGELDVTGASRHIEAKEIEACKSAKIDFIELPVAYDGIAVVVNPANKAVKTLTIAQLKSLWEPDSKVTTWGQVSPEFAKIATLKDTPVKLYGPGPEHGTFDYFTGTVNGKEKSITKNFTAINPEVIVTAIANDKNSLGYFGFAYYVANKDKLKLVAINAGKGAITPSAATIGNETYAPLSRPLFIYVSTKSLERPEVKAFADYYLKNLTKAAPEVGYVALPAKVNQLVAKRLANQITGSIYPVETGSNSKESLAVLLSKNTSIKKR